MCSISTLHQLSATIWRLVVLQQTEIDSEADERNIDPTELKQNVNRDKSGVREDRKRKEEKKRIDGDDEEEKQERLYL